MASPNVAMEVISLFGITQYFSEDTNCILKGEQKYKSGFVLDARMQDHAVHGVVRASMKNMSYKVTLTVDNKGNIEESHCECPRGNWICSHMAATAIYCNRNGFSKTDLPNSWIKKPKTAQKVVMSMAEHFPAKKAEYSALSRAFTEDDKRFLYEELEKSSPCPLTWMIDSTQECVAGSGAHHRPPLMEELLTLFLQNKDQFIEKCSVNLDQINWVAKETSQQRSCSLWGKLKHLRLTSSNFGLILQCHNRFKAKGTTHPSSLFKTLKGNYNLKTNAIAWGKVHENNALQKYCALTGNSVTKIGLVLFPCGFLGSSPDGIISVTPNTSSGVLEIKCPYKYRDYNVSDMITKELNGSYQKPSFYLTSNGELNNQHNYWHQVQGEIHATGVEWADFVVWTTKDLHISRVPKDHDWASNSLPMLQEFYLDCFLPHLCAEKHHEPANTH